jgi:hypothetical protein
MSIRDEMKEKMRLKRMRMGQEAPELVDIPSMPGARVALVPLTEAESMQGMIRAANLDAPENIPGAQMRAREAMLSDIWNAMRDPSDLDKKVFDSIEDLKMTLEPSDVDTMIDELTILMDYASPTLDGLSNEELDNLKKAFVLIDWSELTGRRWSALRLCLSLLLPELLQARFSSTTSTSNSTTRSESDESI